VPRKETAEGENDHATHAVAGQYCWLSTRETNHGFEIARVALQAVVAALRLRGVS
jgi:hypothetical protein